MNSIRWCPCFVPLLLAILVLGSGCRSTEESKSAVPAKASAQANHEPSKQTPSLSADVTSTPSVEKIATPSGRWKKGNAARNPLAIGRYVADRLEWLDKRVRFRVHAESGDYHNCHYKNRKSAVHHVRMRGDGAAYLDGYVPRDKAGEKLWIALKKKPSVKLTVTAVMRSETVSNICTTQVDIIDHVLGWTDADLPLATVGAFERRIANARDTIPAHNRPTITSFQERRQDYIDKTVLFRVRARLDRYYQCRYASAERTHYAISMSGDSFKGLRGYIVRDERGKELANLLSSDEGARLTVAVTIPQGRSDELCADQVEILEWKAGWNAGPPSIP